MPPETQTSSSDNEAKQIRLAEIELRRAELRKRMEEASKNRKAKKGFMTADRKKKLRLLLRKKAAEELKREQERKAEERQWIIEGRCGDPEDLEWASKDDLKDICEDYFQRIVECESDKWDLEYQIRKRAFEISELNSKVNDFRGKFQRPVLKKVSRYDNKFILLQRKAAEFNIKNQLNLRNVKKPDFNLKENKDGDDRRSFRESVERELLTRSSSLRSLLLDDVVEVDVGKIDEEAEESHDEDGLENVAEEDAETDHEMLDELNEEDALANGDINPQGDEHLENIIEEGQDREEHLEDAEARLEGEPRVSEEVDGEEVVTEGEQRLGGQSPDLAGEVQPTDVPESLSPQHTEEAPDQLVEMITNVHDIQDLWHYLKESVSMEHPHTVEEFLQSLIGTLQHVPEDLLQPVIVENIKRANSPCSQTDGERVNSSCSQHQDGESSHQDGGSSAPEEFVTKTEEALDASPAEDDAGRREESLTQHTSDAQEDDVTRDAEGYSIVEASA